MQSNCKWGIKITPSIIPFNGIIEEHCHVGLNCRVIKGNGILWRAHKKPRHSPVHDHCLQTQYVQNFRAIRLFVRSHQQPSTSRVRRPCKCPSLLVVIVNEDLLCWCFSPSCAWNMIAVGWCCCQTSDLVVLLIGKLNSTQRNSGHLLLV